MRIRVGGHELYVEVADSPKERQKGLMFREELEKNEGMLFVFDNEQKLSFWMKDTSLPLSIAFISSDGRITEIQQMEPFSLESVKSRSKVRMALEVMQGVFEEHGIRPGDKVVFPEDFRKGL